LRRPVGFGFDLSPQGRGEVSAERAHPRIQTPAHLLLFARATSLNRAPGSNVMAKGQMRSNKEKKKPKADKNLKKGGATPSPFSSGKVQMQAVQNPYGKKS
jgi:hypothetical protein